METSKIARALRAGRGYWWPTRRLQIIYALLKVVRALLETEQAARPDSTALYEADLNLDITIGKIAQARQDAWARSTWPTRTGGRVCMANWTA